MYSLRVLEVRSLTNKILERFIPSRGSRGKPVSFPFLASRGAPTFLGSRPPHSFSKPNIYYLSVSLSDSDAPASPSYKDICDYFGPIQNIRNNPLISRSIFNFFVNTFTKAREICVGAPVGGPYWGVGQYCQLFRREDLGLVAPKSGTDACCSPPGWRPAHVSL